jgi:hypothetical protein
LLRPRRKVFFSCPIILARDLPHTGQDLTVVDSLRLDWNGHIVQNLE